jgi:transcriptional regulator with XRE-family HTH domain
MSKRPKFSEQLRRAIEAAPVTRYRIAVDTGVSDAVLSRFVNSKVGLSLETVDLLCEYLDLKLVSESNREKKG